MKILKCGAAGDSWCVKLPLDLGTGGGLANALFGKVMGLDDYFNIAHAGDSTEETMGLTMATKLEAILPGTDILLFTGGGDDFAGDQFEIFLNDNAGQPISLAVNMDRLRAGFELTIADYERLVEIRDRIAPQCVIVTQSYDFPPACRMGDRFLTFGPWLKPGLIHRGWTDPVDQAAIVKSVLEAFEQAMAAFAASRDRFVHVNTQGTCTAADWANELHLNEGGCLKVAEKLNLALLPWMDKIKNE
jgi:hypothetical protein